LIRALFDGLFCFDDTDTPEYNWGPPGAVEPTPRGNEHPQPND